MDDNYNALMEDKPETPQQVAERIDKMWQECASYRKKYEWKWKEHERFYHGLHWEVDFYKRPFINEVFKVVEEETPILTDSRPGTDVVAIEDQRSDDARVLKEAIDHIYNYNQLDLILPQAVRTALLVGTGYLYVDWNPELEKGDGQVVIRNMPWRYVYLDPSESNINLMNQIHIKYPEKLATIKRMFRGVPEVARIQAEDIEIDDTTDMALWRDESVVKTGSNSYPSMGQYKPIDMAYIHECYYKDYTMEPIPEEDTLNEAMTEIQLVMQGGIPEVSKYQDHAKIIEQLNNHRMGMLGEMSAHSDIASHDMAGQGIVPEAPPLDNEMAVTNQIFSDLIEQHQAMLEENPEGNRPKYPENMRCIVKVGKIVLYDGPQPVEDGMYPIVPIYCYKLENQSYGVSEIENVIPLQKCIDELNYSEHKALRLCSNPGWIYDIESGIDPDTLTNEEGITVPKKQGTEVSRLQPGSVSPQVAQKIGFYLQMIRDVTGMTESFEGERPKGIIAASAIEALQNQSLARARLKERGIQDAIVRLGELTASRAVKFWKQQRMLRNYDSNGTIQSLVFDPDRLQDLKYLVRVSPGSTVGMNKEYIVASADKLLQAGAIDPETYIIMVDPPFKNLILSKLRERNQMMQQAQALQDQNSQLTAVIEQLTGKKLGDGGALPQGTQAPAQGIG